MGRRHAIWGYMWRLQGSVVEEIHRVGVVEEEEYVEAGVHITAFLPTAVAKRLHHLEVPRPQRRLAAVAVASRQAAVEAENDGWLDG